MGRNTAPAFSKLNSQSFDRAQIVWQTLCEAWKNDKLRCSGNTAMPRAANDGAWIFSWDNKK